MIKILVVEDEAQIARFIELELKHEGYEVEIVGDGNSGLNRALTGEHDLMILDIMLPEVNGMEVCRRVRQEGSEMPIIMLTAKDDVMDKVAGLDKGADDYMTKPFAIEELLARIRVALKKHEKIQNIKKHDTSKEILKHGLLKMNLQSYSVTYGEDDITLTKKEYELLKYLLENKNIALSREKMLSRVWEYEYIGDTNVVDVYIRYLRQKIDQKYDIQLISTVRGVGYIIKDEKEND